MWSFRNLFLKTGLIFTIGFAFILASTLVGISALADNNDFYHFGDKERDWPIGRKWMCEFLPIQKIINDAEAQGKLPSTEDNIPLLYKKISEQIWDKNTQLRKKLKLKNKSVSDYYEWPTISIIPKGMCLDRIENKHKFYNILTEFEDTNSDYKLRVVCVNQEFSLTQKTTSDEWEALRNKYEIRCFDEDLQEKKLR